jgi:hypothetical protein
MLSRVVWYKSDDVSEVLTASNIALTMEAVCTSKTSANLYQVTRHNTPDGRYPPSSRCEKLKSHLYLGILGWYKTQILLHRLHTNVVLIRFMLFIGVETVK